jgi:Zn-dependent protease
VADARRPVVVDGGRYGAGMSSGPNYYYTWSNQRPDATARITTSRTEILQIGIAYAVLTLDLILLLAGAGILYGQTAQFLSRLSVPLVLSAAGAALTGFVCHELSHKIVAQRHGFWAEFRMSVFGLLFSLLTATLGFLWAAPGATVISGMSAVDRENWGKTSLAGPLSNLGFAAIFYLTSAGLYLAHSPYFGWLLLLAWFNAWFATFNLIPFGPLDGAKVLRWRTGVWVASIVGIGAFTAVATLAFYVYGTPLL